MSESPTATDRFWKNVNKDGPIVGEMRSKCWEWTSCLNNGYGQFHIGPENKLCYAHRFSWSLHTGDRLSKRDYICHKCDNPKCVNPDHLFKGDAMANMHDMIAKGRERHRYGAEASEGLRRRKITPDNALEIFRSRGIIGVSELAQRFGICRAEVSHIWHGRSWRWLTGAKRAA